MATPTPVNGQVTDAVTQVNTKVLGNTHTCKAKPLTLAVHSALVDAAPTSVNGQITDTVTQVNTKVLGESPAQVMGNLMIYTSQALAQAAHNTAQQQAQEGIDEQAATAMAISTLFDVDTAASGVVIEKIYH
ncbi:RebB family R body protein [Pseudoalteromonas sp. T1lg23B]|uniref:RebB family R body protein n=1 Tax=Pseudoalteromonas sp. T1lg23B TaxID=2077097 RepID=UPI000CF6C182